jgi:hypothetical protein
MAEQGEQSVGWHVHRGFRGTRARPTSICNTGKLTERKLPWRTPAPLLRCLHTPTHARAARPSREAAAGRLRAYVAQPSVDRKVWLRHDYVCRAANATAAARAAAAPPPPQRGADGLADAWAGVRWYDERLLLTWRAGADGVGRL